MNMQKQKPIWSKILAMLCALALCISMVPAASAAPGGDSSTTNSNVTNLTVTKGDGIEGFATYSTDIGSQIVTDGSVNYQMVDNKLEVTSASSGPLPLAITFYAQADYQPTIDLTNSAESPNVSTTVSKYGNDWWMITVSFGDAIGIVSLNAKAVASYSVTVKEDTGDAGYTLIKGSSDTVKRGESYQFYVIPKTGYQAPNVTVTRGGSGLEPVTPEDGLYTVSNIQSDITITIGNAELQPYTVNFVSGNGYSFVTEDGSTITGNTSTVNYNGNVSFKVNLDGDYDNSNVTVYANGSELKVNEAGVYTIENITVDQTVSVVGVEKNTYQVTLPTDWTGYTISTVDGTSVPAGGTFTFTVTPAAGYTIESVIVNGVNQALTAGKHTITIEKPTTIEITATATQYTVKVSTINANVSLGSTVSYGNNTFTVTPDAGYKVDSVTFDGATVAPGTDNKYTIYVTGNDHHLVVTTSPVADITLTTTVTGAGTTVVTVKTSNDWTSGNVEGVKIVGYGTLYSNRTFDPSALKDKIADRTHSGESYITNNITVYNYYYDDDGIDLSALTGYTFSYKFNSSTSVSAGSRYGAGWIELQQGDTKWIITTASAVALS